MNNKKNTPVVEIRPATAEDAALILRFITDLAIYENAEDEVIATESDIKDSLFASDSTASALICNIDNEAVGFAVYFFNYSTWLAAKGLYLEDLYVDPHFRGKGAGIKLMKHLAKEAVEQGCQRFEWSVLDWNTPSIEFYEAIDAQSQDEWLGYRLEGEPLGRLANS